MYERVCASQETTISMMKEIVDIYSSEIKWIRSTNQDMKNYIDSFRKYSERRAAYPEQSNAHFEIGVNITVNSDSVIAQKKQNRSEKYRQPNPCNKNETNKIIEENANEKIEQNMSQFFYFKAYLDYLKHIP